jgi:PKD repeat protein
MKTLITFLFLLTAAICTETVSAQPAGCQAAFTYTTDSTGYVVTFTNTSVGNFTNLSWSFGDGSSSTQTNPVHFYNSTGPFIVCLTIWNGILGCQSVFCDTIPGGGSSGGCSAYFSTQATGQSVYFYGYLTGGSNPVSYAWDFGDGNTGSGISPQHTYAASGTYSVCVDITTANGCVATYCNTVIVNSSVPCNASFTSSGTGLFNVIQFINTSVGNISTYYWDFGDGTSSTQISPSHIYANAGTYTVCLTVGNPIDSCSSTFCSTVTVANSVGCNAQFGYQNTNMTYTFASSSSASTNHQWSFGDGTTSFSAIPTHTYGAAGTYVVCHTVTDTLNSCTDTWCDSIMISNGGNCVTSFSYTTDSSGTLFAFTGTSSGTQGYFQWSFGDGTGGQGPLATHQYLNPGVYIVCLSILSSPAGNILCSYCDSIVVGSGNVCVPVFYSYPDSNVLGTGNVYFGIYNTCGNTQYVWNFGDGSTGSGISPVHNYADSGWYYVCVTAYTPNGTYTFCDSVYSLRLSSTGIVETAETISLNVYPNPAIENASIAFHLSQKSDVSIALYDVQGKLQAIIYNGNLPYGKHSLNLQSADLQSGIYLLNMVINGSVIHHRIVVQ